ncbi:MAG: formimidoylglutamase [Nonlabens sp.]
MKHFVPFTASKIEAYLPKRFDLTIEADLEREDLSPTFAEKIEICSDPTHWDQIEADYVIVGIPEDIGVRANMGRPGAGDAFKNFLQVFLRQPHNVHNDASRFCLLGTVQTADLMTEAENLDNSIHEDRIQLSNLVMMLDKRVSEVVYSIKQSNKTPIFIGGGHNNCYSVLRTYGYSKPVDCINIDAHTDLRVSKGRHSGNGFSHAIENDFLNNYFMIGIHEQSLTAAMIEKINTSPNIVYAALGTDLDLSVKNALNHIDRSHYGLEIDLDVISNFPSSAQSPVGLNLEEVSNVILELQNNTSPLYYHFCEGAPVYGYNNQVGKALTYLINSLGI